MPHQSSNVRLTKLNTNYEPDPNVAEPQLAIHGDDVLLRFPLNYFHGAFPEGAVGRVRFRNCLMLRVGEPNDEGFFDPEHKKNASRWNKRDYPEMEYHAFYLVEGSQWGSTFGPHAFVNETLKAAAKEQTMKHFVFFMKDGTFECVAEDCETTIPV